jgi:hypothetical protein
MGECRLRIPVAMMLPSDVIGMASVSYRRQLEEQMRCARLGRQLAEFVDDQQLLVPQRQRFVQAPLAARLREEGVGKTHLSAAFGPGGIHDAVRNSGDALVALPWGRAAVHFSSATHS